MTRLPPFMTIRPTMFWKSEQRLSKNPVTLRKTAK